MKKVILGIFFTLLLTLTNCVFVNHDIPTDDWYQDGDILLGVLISIYTSTEEKQCGGGLFPAYIQIAHSVKYAIDDINRNDTLLPNITLGFAMLNYCSRSTLSLARATEFLPRAKSCRSNDCGAQPKNWTVKMEDNGIPNYDVIGVIGTSGSSSSKLVTSLLEVYGIPLISYIATSTDLASAVQNGFFARTVPPDNFQTKALVDIIKHFNWSYISIVQTVGSYGDGVQEVKNRADELGICIGFEGTIKSEATDAQFDELVAGLNAKKKARVVVVFLSMARKFFEAVIRANAQHSFIFLCTDTFSAAVYKGLEKNMPLVLSTRPRSAQVIGFQEYYDTISPWRTSDSHPWYGQFYPEDLGCNSIFDKPCQKYNKTSDIPGFYWSVYYIKAMDVVKIFAVATHNYITANCQHIRENKELLTDCIRKKHFMKFIRNVSTEGYSQILEFDKSNEIISSYDILFFGEDLQGKKDSILIGEWSNGKTGLQMESSMIQWHMEKDVIYNAGVPESVCAKPCGPGQFRIDGDVHCCWECHQCRDNEYVTSEGQGCRRCPLLFWPDLENQTTCVAIEPRYMHWSDSLAVALATLSGVGLLMTVAITIVFLVKRDRKVIRGSSRELMAPITFGLYVCYLTVYAFLAKPVGYACYINYFGFHVSCTLIFGPLFLKTLRMYRIFRAAERCEQKITMVNTRAQVVFTFGIIICQVIILVTIAMTTPPAAKLHMPVATVNHVELLCNLQLGNLFIPLGVNLLLLMLCAVFGFLTRKLPDNFNESWFIFISVTTTIFVWIAFLPTYLLAFYAYHKAALLSLALVLNATVTALCLFAPKIYAVYFVDDKDIKISNFDNSTFVKESSTNDNN